MGTVEFSSGQNNTFLTHADFMNRAIFRLDNVALIEFYGHLSSTANLVLPFDGEIHFLKNTTGQPFAVTGERCFVHSGAHVNLAVLVLVQQDCRLC